MCILIIACKLLTNLAIFQDQLSFLLLYSWCFWGVHWNSVLCKGWFIGQMSFKRMGHMGQTVRHESTLRIRQCPIFQLTTDFRRWKSVVRSRKTRKMTCHPLFPGDLIFRGYWAVCPRRFGLIDFAPGRGISKRSIHRSWINPKTRLHKCNIIFWCNCS